MLAIYIQYINHYVLICLLGKETTVNASFGDRLSALDDGITGDTKVTV